MNCAVSSFIKVSNQEYQIDLLVNQPGSVSVSLSPDLQSIYQSTLSPPPSLSFLYEGVSILSQAVTKVSETEAHVFSCFYSHIVHSIRIQQCCVLFHDHPIFFNTL